MKKFFILMLLSVKSWCIEQSGAGRRRGLAASDDPAVGSAGGDSVLN